MIRHKRKRLKFCSINYNIEAPDVWGLAFTVFKGTFETFYFSGTWNIFNTAEGTQSEVNITLRVYNLNHFKHFLNQSVFFMRLHYCELNVIILFGHGFRNSLKARTPLAKSSYGLHKNSPVSDYVSRDEKRAWGKIGVKNYKITTFWLESRSFKQDF